MIVILIGIIALIVIVLLLRRMMKELKELNEGKTSTAVIVGVLIWLGIPIALSAIFWGIFEPTKMGEWEVKEAIGATLLNSDEENIFDGYTYQYIIPERWSTKPNVINYSTDIESAPILVRCERKGKPTIWTLGLGSTETKYVFYDSEGTINEIQLK